MRKLKVFGGSFSVRRLPPEYKNNNGSNQKRVCGAFTSKSKFGEAVGLTSYELRGYVCESHNHIELAICLANPGKLFYHPSHTVSGYIKEYLPYPEKNEQIIKYKNRKIDFNKKVYIYRNLHDKTGAKTYSIRQNGLVVGHTNQIMLGTVDFKVNQAGRKKVLKTKHKNVHAFIVGDIIESGMGTDASDILPAKISYNPYKNKSFMCYNLTKFPFRVKHAAYVIINKNGVTAAYVD